MSFTVTAIRIDVPDTPTLVPVLSCYAVNGRPAVLLFELEEQEPWCDLTVNLHEALPKGCAFVPYDKRVYTDDDVKIEWAF